MHVISPPHSPTAAFSLVELSIVLVILGLLVGGILGGQSLIHAAEIRSVTTDLDKYRTAVYTFKDKYFALPGDMDNAVRFWGAAAGGTADGTDATCMALDETSPSTGTETCNGDGNGQVSASPEMLRFWQHLANAGMIAGSYSGVTSNSSVSDRAHSCPLNCPTGKITGTGFSIYHLGNENPSYVFAGDYGNVYTFGGDETGYETIGALLSPQDAWNIDTKLDDGKPGKGVVRPRNNSSPGGNAGCTTSDDPDVSIYSLTADTPLCGLYFITGL